MNKNSSWETSVKPVVVLSVIALIVSLLLAMVNSFTAPIIEDNQKAATLAAYVDVMPTVSSASDLEEVTDYTTENITGAVKATDGSLAIKAEEKGFEMQHGMHGQKCHFPLQRMAVEGRLLLGALHADDYIAQHFADVVFVHIIFAIHTQREAQNVGGHGLVAVLVVQLCNGRVVHKGHADLSRSLKVLELQHSVAGAADQDAEAGRDLDGLLGIGDQT